jgi:ABC-type dipeptide/oligopeptide/nickel transport system permease subunit
MTGIHTSWLEPANPGSLVYRELRPNRVWTRLLGNRSGLTGFILIVFFGLLALGVSLGVFGQSWSTADGGSWESAGFNHWFGTNKLGQDIFQRSVFSVGIAFEIGLVVALAATFFGAISGALAGWYADSWADEITIFLTGVLDSIPFYLFVAAVAYALQGNPWSMHIAMIATFWTTTSRLVRAEVMRLKQRDFVQASKAMGLPVSKILTRHVLPNALPVLLAQFALVFVAAIKSEVILSFLGLGVRDGVSWGLMLAESAQEISAGHFNNLLAASIPLFLLLLGINLMVDALQDAFDPRQGVA